MTATDLPNARPPGLATGLLAGLPIVMGYFPIAFSFGVAATRPGSPGSRPPLPCR
jgi:predicted branched-subunit amino acid permease